MTIEEALQLFTYKPGWTFGVGEGYFEGQKLVKVRYENRSSLAVCDTWILNVPMSIQLLKANEPILQWLLWELYKIERHIADEWFRIDGVMLHDPHKDDK